MGTKDLWYGWGNPDVDTFKKRFIRTVKTGGTLVQVHSFIADIVSEIIESTMSHGATPPEELEGWLPHSPEPLVSQGRCIRPFDGLDENDWSGWGFRHINGWLVFDGSATEAKELSKRAESERVIRSIPRVEKPNDSWQTCPPGSREVKLGDKGDDVMFFQMFVGAQNVEGVCLWNTLSYANLWQKRVGCPVTGTIDSNVWKAILPTSLNYAVEYGSSGLIVRCLQCILLAYGWVDEIQVTGRFDQVTYAAIKHLQDTFGIRSTGACDMPEWAVLLGRQVRSV